MPKRIIGFDKKSIKNVIQNIEDIQNTLMNGIRPTYLQKVLSWIKNRAEVYLDASGIGNAVISEIKNSWQIVISKNVGQLINTSDKSVYVEFGVGIVGEQGGYPTTYGRDFYKYDYNNRASKTGGYWTFNIDDSSQLDLRSEYAERNQNSKGVTYYRTQGQPAVKYLFKAIADFEQSNMYKTLWAETLDEFLGKRKA